MISVSLRTLLFYNFGFGLAFLLIGTLSVYSLDYTKPNRANESPAFAGNARLAIESEKEVDAVRDRALFYFDVARDMRRARMQDDSSFYEDVRILSFAVAGLFMLGGILALLLPRARAAGH
jgi:hypothetical protein